jgi:hypothetical protein
MEKNRAASRRSAQADVYLFHLSGDDPGHRFLYWHHAVWLVRITEGSAIPLVVLFYFALMGALVFIGAMVHWMSKTYSASLHAYKGFVFMGLCCTPVFLAGALAAYPIWWVDILVAIAACSYAIRLIYLGIPDVMKVPEDLGFLYASAVFAVALVYVVVVLVGTVLLWEYIAFPVFTN